jgi:hypothetical protein
MCDMPSPFAPPPALSGGRPAVAVDGETIDAHLVFDVVARRAQARATVTFTVDGPGGYPALDLRQPVASVALDGRALAPDSFAHVNLGGGPGSEMRVLDHRVETGERHRLDLTYELGTPDAEDAEPVGWQDGGVRFDLWMSDLYPGRYLEMWIPSPLCHDRFALTVHVEVVGADRPHLLLSNAGPVPSEGRAWTVRYPASFTSLSPMLVLAPADEIEWRSRPVTIAGRAEPIDLRTARHREVDTDLEACEADIAAWIPYLASRYGPWTYGPAMTVLLWESTRGMEYDGATTASVGALEHEIFHSWFGRGVKPARASDGWIDEAWTCWATASRQAEAPRFDASPLDLDARPVLLYPPHPWSRHTPRESYSEGSRLFAGLASVLGGPERLRSAMAAWYHANAGGLVTTDGLEAHLRAWSGVDVTPWFARYVHGRADRP